jgi:hypothetical protein
MRHRTHRVRSSPTLLSLEAYAARPRDTLYIAHKQAFSLSLVDCATNRRNVRILGNPELLRSL